MQSILNYIINVFSSLVDILSVKPFSDFPITIFQFMCTIIVIRYLFNFIFGGTKEFERFTNGSIKNHSQKISDSERKNQLVNEHYNITKIDNYYIL